MQQPWARPAEIRDLPFDLLRSQNYPLLGHSVVGAILNQMSPGYKPIDVLLPQRMGFRSHKTDPDGRHFGDWTSLVTGAVRAFSLPAQLTNGAPRASAPGVPFSPLRQVARSYFDHLPRASDKMEGAQIQNSELPARIDRVPPTMLDDLARSQSTFADKVSADRFTARTAAMTAITQAQAVIRSAVGR